MKEILIEVNKCIKYIEEKNLQKVRWFELDILRMFNSHDKLIINRNKLMDIAGVTRKEWEETTFKRLSGMYEELQLLNKISNLQ